jgi:hypothetical protein
VYQSSVNSNSIYYPFFATKIGFIAFTNAQVFTQNLCISENNRNRNFISKNYWLRIRLFAVKGKIKNQSYFTEFLEITQKNSIGKHNNLASKYVWYIMNDLFSAQKVFKTFRQKSDSLIFCLDEIIIHLNKLSRQRDQHGIET